jgi:NADH dehydrogenase
LLNALHRLRQAIVTRLLKARLRGADLPPFCYRDFSTMATIGRERTVVQLGRLKLSGFLAWHYGASRTFPS